MKQPALVLFIILSCISTVAFPQYSKVQVAPDRKLETARASKGEWQIDSEGWMFVGFAPGTVITLDWLSIKWTSRDSAEAWFNERLLKRTKKVSGYSRLVMRYRLDCSAEKLQLLSWTRYGNNGNVLGVSTTADKAHDVIPGSIGESMLRTVCQPAKDKN